METHYKIALVGNPNCGKTTLLNALTGSRQKTGNWPGVTVDRLSGYFTCDGKDVEVVDLPGTYSLVSSSEKTAIDEDIACDYILSQQADVIVNVIDASNFERNLYLTAQLLDLNVPMIVVLNMVDLATKRGWQLDLDRLQAELQCPIVPVVASKKQGIDYLQQKIIELAASPYIPSLHVVYPDVIKRAQSALMKALSALESTAPDQLGFTSLRLLEDDYRVSSLLSPSLKETTQAYQQQIAQAIDDADIVIADSRYQFCHALAQRVLQKPQQKRQSLSKRIDKIVLNRFLGLPIFFLVMYLMFLFAINVGGAFQDFFDITTDTIFVKGFAALLLHWHCPTWLIAILASGVGKGINTTVTFIPIIATMFFFLSFLESSGYMARAAFVMDRVMRFVGLPGKAFVPMIVGLGCNVPAIMAARTLENKRDRILTILMSPFMSCSARLAIFAVFVAAFFPHGGQNIVFLLYLAGILMAVFTGFVLRKTLLTGKPAPFIMELPPYHMPTLNALLKNTWSRLKYFVFRAGKVIVPVCILIGALNAFTLHGTVTTADANAQSLLSVLGQWLTPVFSPMGIHQDNWPATVGLLTGMLAKEVVIATLNTLYSQVGHFALQLQHFSFWGGLHEALASIPANLAALPHALANPILASAPDSEVTNGVYGLMYHRFDGQIGAFAYLLFVVLYIPCVSSAAAISRELHRAWAWFSVVWSVALAYVVAVLFYQIARFSEAPLHAGAWIIGVCALALLGIIGLRCFARRQRHRSDSHIRKPIPIVPVAPSKQVSS